MANLLRIQTVWTGIAGAPFYTTMFFLSEDTLAGAQAAGDAVDAFWDDLVGNIHSLVHYQVQHDVEVIDSATGGLVGSYTIDSAGHNGVASGDILPRASQGIVRWETGAIVEGRRLRGHTYIPGLVESLNGAGGAPSTGWTSVLGIAAATLTGDPDSALVVYSRTHGTFEPANGYSVPDEWAVLRSRRD